MSDDTTKRPDYFAHVAATAARTAAAANAAKAEESVPLLPPLDESVWPLIAVGDRVRLSNGNRHVVLEPPIAVGTQVLLRVAPLEDDPRLTLQPSDSLLVPMFQVCGHEAALGAKAIAELVDDSEKEEEQSTSDDHPPE